MKSFSLLLSWLTLTFASVAAPEKFELRDGDRVVFIGGAFIEREQEEGHIETMLTAHSLDKQVTFRNLGWTGDTVGSHLPGFTGPETRQGYVPKLFSYVEKIQPTVVFVSFGMMESFNGPSGLDKFIKDYEALLDKLSATTKRIVIISPIRHEKLGGLFPDPKAHNENVKLYSDATRSLAEKRGLVFVDLFNELKGDTRNPITSNGVHLNSLGYINAAHVIAKQLGWTSSSLPESQKSAIKSGLQPLRAAIKKKNKQFWYYYRPMNSEYMYAGGTRFQNKMGPVEHRLDTELDDFYKLAEKEDGVIAELKQKLARGEKIPAPKKSLPESRPIQRDPTAPDPEVERASFQVADGFEVNLFAADPLIAKPIQMSFDARGRLWVATTTKYPQIKPGETQDDKIIILEDKDGDGRADKTTVFADDLLIPTGILPVRGGCYTFDDTKFLFLHDRDGDDHNDETEILLSGFGTEDSHHKGHVLRFSPGGNIYFNQGVFLHSVIETAYGIVSQSGNWLAGIFEYDPATAKFDVYLANSVPPNPWGHYWNRWGFDFHIDSSGQQGSNFILPTANKTSSALEVPGGTGKLAGGEIISGRHLPDEWQGRFIANPFKENRTAFWEFRDDGSGFAMKQLGSLITSTNNSFRGVDIRMGPDGAIYIADWYNPLIGHMQYHFRDPGRDFTHGRIWRVTAKNRPLVPKPDFVHASAKELLEMLKSPEDFTRATAKRILAERGAKKVVPALQKWVKNLDAKNPDYDHQRLEALWTYQNLNVVEPELLKSVLRANEPNARAAATIVLRYWRDKISNPLDLLAAQVIDENPRVRLQAVIALSYIPDRRAMELALAVLDRPMDRYLDQALKNTAAALKPVWQPALDAGDAELARNNEKLQYLMKSADSSGTIKRLLKMLKAGKLTAEQRANAVESVTSSGTAEELAELFDYIFEPELEAKLLQGIAKAVHERKLNPKLDRTRLKTFCEDKNEAVRAAAFRLAGGVKLHRAVPDLTQAAEDANTPSTTRQAAFDALANIGGTESVEVFQRLAKEARPEIRAQAINAWSAMDLKAAANAAVEFFGDDGAADHAVSVVGAFLQRADGSATLASIVAAKHLSNDVAKLGLRAMQTAGRQDAELMKALSSAAGLDAEAKPLSVDEMNSLVAEVRAKGDPARGERIFHRKDLSCFQCHAINGAGGQVGPDLGAVGTGSQVDYLIDSILFPNKIIKDSFETIEVTTKDDDYILGIKVRDNKEQLVLKDATRPEIVIPTATIRERNNKKISIMPSGLANSLTHAELLDLVRFLSELGKPGDYANTAKPVVRRWRLLDGDGAKADWVPAYSFVNGDLETHSPAGIIKARCDVDVSAPGKVSLRLNSVNGLKLLVDDAPVKLSEKVILELPSGVHPLAFEIDSKKRNQPLRVELDEVPGSNARFQIISGR